MLKVARGLMQSARLALASGLSPRVEYLEVIQRMSIFAALSIRRKNQEVTCARYVFNDRSVMDPPHKKGEFWR